MLTRREHNATTGLVQDIPVDDNYMLSIHGKEVDLTASALTLALNGTITLSAQLFTPPLADGNRQLATDSIPIRLKLGTLELEVILINGVWSDTLQFVAVGTYQLRCISHNGNQLEVIVS